jgi:hypothetical protein
LCWNKFWPQFARIHENILARCFFNLILINVSKIKYKNLKIPFIVVKALKRKTTRFGDISLKKSYNKKIFQKREFSYFGKIPEYCNLN